MKSYRSNNENQYSILHLNYNEFGPTVSRGQLIHNILRNNTKNKDKNKDSNFDINPIYSGNPNNIFLRHFPPINRNSNDPKEVIKLRLTLPKPIKKKKTKHNQK